MPSKSDAQIIAHIDGGSRGNPGPAAYAVVLEAADGARLGSFSKFLGRATNNFAEYQGLLAALEYALAHDYRRLRVESDSELLVRQVQGRYKVKSPDLRPLWEQARRMIDRFEAFSIRHVPREQNTDADRLVNKVLDAAQNQPNVNHTDDEAQRNTTADRRETHLAEAKTQLEMISAEEDSARASSQGEPTREPIPEEVNRVSGLVVDAAFRVHSSLGPGLIENIYKVCLAHELKKHGLSVEQGVEVPVYYDGIRLEAGLRLDLLVEKSVVVEPKSVETVLP